MGFFSNIKNLFSKKKEEIEEVKEELNVETIEELKEELEEPTEEVEEDFDLDDDGIDDFKKSDFEATEVHEPDLDIDDDGEDDFVPSDFDDNENIQELKQEEVLEKIEETKKGWFFKKEKKEKVKQTITYDKGLEKTRKEFVSSLSLLGKKFGKVNDDYFDELEEILIKDDIGVNTVMKFLDRL